MEKDAARRLVLRAAKSWSRTVSRVLFYAAIPLGCGLLRASSSLPERFGRASLERVPIWPFSGRGLPSRPRRRGRWWALTPPFHPYPLRGGLLSVALSGDRSPWGLPSVLPCGARTFLPEPKGSRRRLVQLQISPGAQSGTLHAPEASSPRHASNVPPIKNTYVREPWLSSRTWDTAKLRLPRSRLRRLLPWSWRPCSPASWRVQPARRPPRADAAPSR